MLDVRGELPRDEAPDRLGDARQIGFRYEDQLWSDLAGSLFFISRSWGARHAGSMPAPASSQSLAKVIGRHKLHLSKCNTTSLFTRNRENDSPSRMYPMVTRGTRLQVNMGVPPPLQQS